MIYWHTYISGMKFLSTRIYYKPGWVITFCWLALSVMSVNAETTAVSAHNLKAGPNDAILLEPDGLKPGISINTDKLLIPASTLKILTALAVIHELGIDYRFKTEFYLDTDNNLIIKGYGDPLLISEEIAVIAEHLKTLIQHVNHLIVDSSYYDDISIPGIVGSSIQPYNAQVGALCVNFNTVNFDKKDGKFISAEPQTPLLPFALERIKRQNRNRGRIVLTPKNHENALYAGHLFQYFFSQAGIRTQGTIRPGTAEPTRHRLIYVHRSSFTLDQLVNKLMVYSNNFIANQALITAGANRFGAPGTLDKGLTLMHNYLKDNLNLKHLTITEGSGISSQNRLSAKDLLVALEAFKPYYALLRHEGDEYFKTGTLPSAHVNARAGYFEHEGQLRRFVVLINTPKISIDQVMRRIRRY